MAQIVAHTAAAFHQLHLFLINSDHTSVRIRIAVEADYKTVAQRAYLKVIAYS